MKNAKIILLVLIGVLLICSFGCGGGGGGVDDEGNSEPQPEQEQQEQQEQTDERVSRLVEKILTPASDGSPAIFDYAPKPESSDEYAASDTQQVKFAKYISSRDLNSNGEFVQKIRLNENSEYVIKYSRSGRSLNNSSLGLTILAPDKNEMILDSSSSGNPEVSNDVTPAEELTEEQIQALFEESGMTREEFDAELELAKKQSENSKPYSVPTELEIIPEENPCIIMYRFKAPLTGDYEFAVSELTLLSGGGLVKNVSFDIPFEFRIYGSEESYSAADDEEIELTPRQILDVQRMLLSSATEFNENGLPIAFENSKSDVSNSGLKYDDTDLHKQMEDMYRDDWMKAYQRVTQVTVIPDAVINNVPYDKIFEEGAGFYAHSGLRSVTNVIDDEAFSKNAVNKFTMPTPANGSTNNMKENFKINVIATEEEHDRNMELGAMSNFALLRDALGYTTRQDYARLGSDHTKIISVRYEFIEDTPRTPDPKIFRLYDEAMDELKEKGSDYFTNEYGDYFVAGYTWGTRYDATIEIVTVPGESYYQGANYRLGDRMRSASSVNASFFYILYPQIFDAALVCNDAAKYVQDIFTNVVKNAIAERDTGKSDDEAKKRIESLFKELQEDFHKVTIKVSHSSHTGKSGNETLSVKDFANKLADFVKSARKTPRYQYEKLYVTLKRYREIESVKSYIPEAITTPKSRYEKIRNLTERIFRTRCYYNALMAIPASHLKNGTALQEQWKKEFETELITRMKGGLNYICSDEGQVNEYYNNFNALYEKYKALAERYNFYRYFILVKKDASSPSWSDSDSDYDDSWTRGFNTYNKSKIVLEDIKAGRHFGHRHSEPWYKGPRGATFSGNLGEDYVFWFKTGYHDTNHCKGYDVQGKTIGINSYNWKYEGASSRRCEVFLEIKTVKLDPKFYPFAGL